jgi:hypothetical protein
MTDLLEAFNQALTLLSRPFVFFFFFHLDDTSSDNAAASSKEREMFELDSTKDEESYSPSSSVGQV